MKSMNTKPTGPHQSHTKWGLFVLLAGSLGFTLSMNPDHFNNIARNEYGMSGVFELAQQAPPAAATGPSTAKAAATPAPAAKPAETKLTAEQKDRKEKLAKMRSSLKEQGVEEAKLNPILDMAEDLMRANVPLYHAVLAGLKTYGYSDKDARAIILPLYVASVADEAVESKDANTDAPPKVKALSDKEKDELIAQHQQEIQRIMNQLPASAQSADPGTPDQQVQAAKAAAAKRANRTNSEFGNSGNSRPPVSANPPNQQVPQNRQVSLMGERSNVECTLSIEQEDGETIGRVEKIEGKTCPLEKKVKFRNTSIDDFDAIKKMAQNMFRDKIDKKDDKDGEREEEKAKVTAAKEAWDKAQKRCKGRGMDLEDKMDCVQENLAKLSEDLDDSTASKNLLKKAYNSSMVPLLRTAMTKPLVTFDQYGRAILNSEPKMANQTIENLIDSLGDSGNASSIVSDLERKSIEGLRNQVTMAQNMYSSAKNEQKNPRTFQRGIYQEAASNTFMNQIGTVWPNQDLSAILNSVTNNGPFTPGMGSLTSIPPELAEQRIRAQTQYRGYQVPAPSTFGTRSTINGQLTNNQNWNQNQNLLNQGLPGRGSARLSGIYSPELTIP